MTLGLLIAAIALISLPFLDGLYLYLALIAVLGTGNGLVLPALNTLVTSTASGTHRGGVTSVYGSSRFIGVAFGPPIFSLLNRISAFVMFASAAAIALLVAASTFYFVEEEILLAEDQEG
jgi:ACDE family multidrug resistance protein